MCWWLLLGTQLPTQPGHRHIFGHLNHRNWHRHTLVTGAQLAWNDDNLSEGMQPVWISPPVSLCSSLGHKRVSRLNTWHQSTIYGQTTRDYNNHTLQQVGLIVPYSIHRINVLHWHSEIHLSKSEHLLSIYLFSSIKLDRSASKEMNEFVCVDKHNVCNLNAN